MRDPDGKCTVLPAFKARQRVRDGRKPKLIYRGLRGGYEYRLQSWRVRGSPKMMTGMTSDTRNQAAKRGPMEVWCGDGGDNDGDGDGGLRITQSPAAETLH